MKRHLTAYLPLDIIVVSSLDVTATSNSTDWERGLTPIKDVLQRHLYNLFTDACCLQFLLCFLLYTTSTWK